MKRQISTSFAPDYLAIKTPESRSYEFGSVALGAWKVGCAVLGFMLLICQVALMQLRRRSKSLTTGAAFDRLARLSGDRQLKAPALGVDPLACSPFLAGIRRPSIYLPNSLAEAGDEELDPIFAHELCHLAQRDCLWRLVERVTCAVLWPQPLIWILCRKLEESVEVLCDQRVLQDGLAPERYAKCLLNLASTQVRRPAHFKVSAGVVDFRSSVGKRIAAILDSSKRFSTRTSKRVKAAGAAAVIAVPACAVAFVSNGIAKRAIEDDPFTTFTKESDPAAVAAMRSLVERYRGLDTLSVQIGYDDGNREVDRLIFKRSIGAYVTASGNNSMKTVKRVYATRDSVVEIDAGSSGTYKVAKRPTEQGSSGTWPVTIDGIQAASNIAHIRIMTISALVNPIQIPKGWGSVKPATARMRGVKTLNGSEVEEVELSRPGESIARLSIGRQDHLLYRQVTLTPDGKVVEQESYSDIKVDTPVADSEVEFVPPAGAKEELMPTSYIPGQKIDKKAQPIVDDLIRTYSNLKTLSFVDRVETKEQVWMGPKQEVITQHKTLKVAFDRSGDYRMDLLLDDYSRQNEHVVVHNGTSYATMDGQPDHYIQGSDHGFSVNFGGLGIVGGDFPGLSVAGYFYSRGEGQLFHEATLGKDGPLILGEPTQTLVDVTNSTPVNGDGSFEQIQTYYIGRKSHLVLRAESKMTSTTDGRTQTSSSTDEFTELKSNQPLDPSNFQFVPPTGATPVSDWKGMQSPSERDAELAPKLGEIFPDFESVDMQGKLIRLSGYRGKLVLLHAWTFGVANYEWDLPHYEKLSQQYGPQGLVVIGIVGEGPDMRSKVEKYLDDHNIRTRQVFDGQGEESGILKALHISRYPYTYLIGRDGQILATDIMDRQVDKEIAAALKSGN